MDCKSLLKARYLSVILSVLATHPYAYQLPGDPQEDSAWGSVPELNLQLFDGSSESTMTEVNSDAAALEYRINQPKGLSIISSYSNRLEQPFENDGESNLDGFWDLKMQSPALGVLPAIEFDYNRIAHCRPSF